MAKFDIDVKLTGENGNAFAIIAKVIRAMRESGCTDDDIVEYQTDAMSSDYNHLLRVTMQTVNVQ